jgi:hypothetical protein
MKSRNHVAATVARVSARRVAKSGMTLAYIAIGSNLASPLEQVNAAVQALGEIPESRIIAVSSFYRTPPPLGRRISLTTSTPPSCWKPP